MGRGHPCRKLPSWGSTTKNVFQVHGAAADGPVLFRKKLTRPQFHRFMAEQPACPVAMEACGGAHYWAREMR
jgi:transposase